MGTFSVLVFASILFADHSVCLGNALIKSNHTRTESSAERISEFGPLLTTCPFALKKNEMMGRIPSTFYELECLTCNKCGRNGYRCTQVMTEIDALFLGIEGDSWVEPINVKAGCSCTEVSRRSSANIRP